MLTNNLLSHIFPDPSIALEYVLPSSIVRLFLSLDDHYVTSLQKQIS